MTLLTLFVICFIWPYMDCSSAIECHRQPLLRIVAGLYVMIGIAQGGMVERLARPMYRMVLSLLRPAEAAVRRLIIVAAQGLVAEPRTSRTAPARRATPRRKTGE